MASLRTEAVPARTGGIIRRGVCIAALALVIAGGIASGTAHAQEAPGLVRVVHGLRGLVADIYLDGALALPTFQPERSTDPLSIPAGDHLIEIRSAGAAMTDTPLLTQTVTVPAGFQGSLVAHLDGSGNPTLSAFPDDLTAVPAGQTRMVVRHAAAAEDVAVLLNEVASGSPITSKAESLQLLGAGTYRLAVAPVGGGAPITAPQSVQYDDGTANFMYLIGSQADSTLGWAVVRVSGLQSAPTGIQTGDGSTLGDGGNDGLVLALAVAAGVVGVTGVGTAVVRARSRQVRSSR